MSTPESNFFEKKVSGMYTESVPKRVPLTEIGQAIEGMRAPTGLSKTDFADRYGVSRVHYHQIISGKRIPEASTLQKFGIELECVMPKASAA